MNEKDLIQKIKDDARTVAPPESLSPKAVEKMLSDQKKQRRRTVLRYGSLAAVVAVAFTALWQYRHLSVGSRSEYTADYADAANSAETGSQATSEGETSFQNSPAAGAYSETSASAESAPVTEQLTYAESYEAVYEALRESISADYRSGKVLYGATASVENSGEIAVAEDADYAMEMAGDGDYTAEYSGGSGAESASDFSETNVQEQGVDEGDIVKTDGTCIYILRTDLTLAIVQAEGGASETVSVTDFSTGNDAWIEEMYLDGDTLNIILSEYVSSLESEGDAYYTDSRVQTRIITYNVKDPGEPVQTGSVTQEGSYLNSRKNGDYLYLFTRYTPVIQDTYEESTLVPLVNGSRVSADHFYLPDSLRSTSYLLISSVDAASPGEILDTKVLVSGATDFYVSTENIYIANETWDSSQTCTEITKFHYAGGRITGVAAGSVRGYLNNSFSMNEYEGYLRVVTTYYGGEENRTEHNALYVLDESLGQTGAIEGLAGGETIRSARFFGDTGYFVTFKETDPLFCADLSDPSNPRILGELEISGFSSYLHFYGDGLLLGIGYEADEETGITTGIKLSMFDISDPANLTEVNRFVISGITWCPAIENYKAILAEPEKNLIGFYCDNRYMVFSYDEEGGFTRELLYDFYSDMLTGKADYDTMRGLYIGSDLYLAGNTFLVSFDIANGFEKTGVRDIP